MNGEGQNQSPIADIELQGVPNEKDAKETNYFTTLLPEQFQGNRVRKPVIYCRMPPMRHFPVVVAETERVTRNANQFCTSYFRLSLDAQTL